MPPTTAAATTTTTARPQQHVVVFGDSVPAGTACDCGGFGANVASVLAGALSNFAVPGLTTEGLLDQLNTPSAADALRSANVVLVTIGANDFNEADASDPSCSDLSCYSATMQTVTANVRSIVSQIKALAPSGTRILLTGYWNVFLDGQVGAANGPIYVDTSDALSRQLNSNLAQLSRQQGVLYTDVYTPFKGSGNVDDTGLLASDGDHPDVAGHRVIANAILATLHANG
jgi:lysophospholipase L1-like esterase